MTPSTEISANDQPDVVTTKSIKPRRRWLSFSLRTMMIVVTLLTVIFGVWINRTQRQQSAIKAIAAYAPNPLLVMYENEVHPFRTFNLSNLSRTKISTDKPQPITRSFEKTNIPEWLLHLLGPDYFYNVEHIQIDFSSNAPSAMDQDQVIVHLQGLPHLKTLRVQTNVEKKLNSDRLIEICGDLTELKYLRLDLPWHNLNRMNVDHLKELRGAKIHLTQLAVQSDDDFSLISELDQVETLWNVKVGERVTVNGLRKLKSLSKLVQLELIISNADHREEFSLCLEKEFRNLFQAKTHPE